jgi:hypothetical protein
MTDEEARALEIQKRIARIDFDNQVQGFKFPPYVPKPNPDHLDEVPVTRPSSLDTPPLTNEEYLEAIKKEKEVVEAETDLSVDETEQKQAHAGVIPQGTKDRRSNKKAIIAIIGSALGIAGTLLGFFLKGC